MLIAAEKWQLMITFRREHGLQSSKPRRLGRSSAGSNLSRVAAAYESRERVDPISTSHGVRHSLAEVDVCVAPRPATGSRSRADAAMGGQEGLLAPP